MKNGIEKKEIVGFVFGEIDAEEGRKIVIAGDGNYSDLKATVLEAIPQLPDGKWFQFGLPEGERKLTEMERRGICVALNSALRRAGLSWKTTYSGSKKLFLVLPKNPKMVRGNKSQNIYTSNPDTVRNVNTRVPGLSEKVHELRARGVKRSMIAKELNIPIGRVDYYSYKTKPEGTPPLASAVEFVTNVKRFFKTDHLSQTQRKAACVVGKRVMHIHHRDLGPPLGLSGDGVEYHARSSSGTAAAEIRALTKAFEGR